MLRPFLSSFSVVLIGVACAFFTHVILAKILPASEYGVFSFVYSISLLLSVFSLFGFQNSLVRLIANFEGSHFKIRRLIRFSRLFTCALAILSAGACYAVLYALEVHDKYPQSALLLSIVLVPLMVWVRLHSSIMRGFKKSTVSVLYETTLREIILLLSIGVLFLWGYEIESGFNALVLFGLSLFIVSLISWCHVRKFSPSCVGETPEYKSENKQWIKLSLPMMFTIFAQRLLRRSDIIILGLMTHPALVGAYAIVAQFADVSSIGQKGVFAVFSARAASLYQAKSSVELKGLYKKMQLYGAVSTGVMSVGIAVLAPYVLGYFGDAYGVGYNALLILLVGQFINVCFGPVGVLMIMTKYERETMKLTFMVAIGNIIFNPLAIYFYGLEGAALVTAFFFVLRALLSYIFVKRQGLI